MSLIICSELIQRMIQPNNTKSDLIAAAETKVLVEIYFVPQNEQLHAEPWNHFFLEFLLNFKFRTPQCKFLAISFFSILMRNTSAPLRAY